MVYDNGIQMPVPHEPESLPNLQSRTGQPYLHDRQNRRQNGKYEYTLRGGRLVAMFTVKFTPTAAGMRIQVTQQDGQRYS